jgi:hypothetical protein
MIRSNRGWLVLVSAIAMLVVLGCSHHDDAVNVPVEQTVQANLNSALTTTVVPLVSFMAAVGNLLSPPAAVRGGYACPDTTSWCGTGSVTCTPTASGLEFDFNQCQTITGEGPMTVGGIVVAVPSLPSIYLTLTNFSINGSTPMAGSGSINSSTCDYNVNIYTADASVAGTVTICDADPYPTGNALTIDFDSFYVLITFDGSNTAGATAFQDGLLVANCTINLDANPLTSSCYAV